MYQINKPGVCQAIGLECRDCVTASARQLAKVCGSMPSDDVRRMFFTMYEDPACAPMASEFSGSYRSAARGGAAGVAALEPGVGWFHHPEPVPVS